LLSGVFPGRCLRPTDGQPHAHHTTEERLHELGREDCVTVQSRKRRGFAHRGNSMKFGERGRAVTAAVGQHGELA